MPLVFELDYVLFTDWVQHNNNNNNNALVVFNLCGLCVLYVVNSNVFRV